MKGKKKRRTILFLINICIPLVVGLFIYLIYDADTYVTGFFHSLFGKSKGIYIRDGITRQIIRNYLADGCWAYALTFSVMFFMEKKESNLIIGGLVCFAFSLLMEVCQNSRIIHGTFDVFDIVIEAVFIVLALTIIKKEGKNYEEDN